MPVEVNEDQPFFFSRFNLSFACLLPSGVGEKRFTHIMTTVSLGDDGIDEYKKPASTSSRSSVKKPTEAAKTTTTVTSQEQLLRERFRIYFPTDRTVSNSRGGRNVSCDPRVIYTARPTNPVLSPIMFLDFFLQSQKMTRTCRREARYACRPSGGGRLVSPESLCEM